MPKDDAGRLVLRERRAARPPDGEQALGAVIAHPVMTTPTECAPIDSASESSRRFAEGQCRPVRARRPQARAVVQLEIAAIGRQVDVPGLGGIAVARH